MNVRGRSVRSFGLGFESSVGETVPVFVRCLIGIQVAVELYMYRVCAMFYRYPGRGRVIYVPFGVLCSGWDEYLRYESNI